MDVKENEHLNITHAGLLSPDNDCLSDTHFDKTMKTSDGKSLPKDAEDDTAVAETVDPPDGGWGWVVTFAGFMVGFLLDGVYCSFGLLLPELLDTFGSSLSLTSFAQAVYVAMFLGTGPAAAFLVRRFGCRLVGFCGDLVASLGMVCSAYAPNIELFIFFYGAVTGFGVGLIFLPSVTMANLYFEKKRGVVAGIITSGSGIGLLALAPLTELLVKEFGWRGCNLITGGIVLNFCVCASLIRPLPLRKTSTKLLEDETASDEDIRHGDLNSHLVDEEIRHDGVRSRLVDGELRHEVLMVGDQSAGEKVMTYDENGETELEKIRPSDSELSPEQVTRISTQESGERLGVDEKGGKMDAKTDAPAHKVSDTGLKAWSSIKHLFLGQNSLGGSHTHITGKRDRSGKKEYNNNNNTQRHISQSTPHLPYIRGSNSASQADHFNVFSTWLETQVPPSLSRRSLNQSAPGLQASSVRKRHPRARHQESLPEKGDRYLTKNYGREDSTEDAEASLLPEDNSTSSDSFAPKPSSVRAGSSRTGLGYVTTSAAALHDRCEVICSRLKGQRVLLVFLAGAFLVQFACNVPALLMPSYAHLHGVSRDQSAQILSIFGLMNTVGRLGAGLLVYWGCGSLRVHNVGTALAGVACFLFPLCTSFPSITACLAFTGLFLGAFPPLQPVMLAEYLGAERLTSVFGTLSFVKAFGNLAGVPSAGAVYGVTGLYTVPVAGCGAVLVLAGLLHELIPCCTRPRGCFRKSRD